MLKIICGVKSGRIIALLGGYPGAGDRSLNQIICSKSQSRNFCDSFSVSLTRNSSFGLSTVATHFRPRKFFRYAQAWNPSRYHAKFLFVIFPACFNYRSRIFNKQEITNWGISSFIHDCNRWTDDPLPSPALHCVFVALETVALCFILLLRLIGIPPIPRSWVKYLIFGALSSALFLLGIVLLYGVGSNPVVWGATLPTSGLTDAFSFHGLYHLSLPTQIIYFYGRVVLLSECFKIGAAPFQIWVPDVYHGAPMPVTAFLAVSSKAAGFLCS